MAFHLLTNFEIQKFYQNVPRFNSVYSRNHLPKIKDGAYVIHLDEYKSIGAHWIALHVNNDVGTSNDVTYFDSFCIGFIDFMLEGKSLLEYNNVYYPNKYKMNDKIILKYF